MSRDPAARAVKLPGSVPPWLFLIGPPAGTKTELVMLVKEVPGTYPLSSLTAKTFASGLKVDDGQPDPSLLSHLHDEILIFKDFTTVLQQPSEEQATVLAQLREIFDGSYTMAWGTGKKLEWEGRLGFIAGVTEAIDAHHSVMALLGPRFLMHRPRNAERDAVARRALRNSKNKHDELVRARHARAIAAYLAGLPVDDPDVPETVDVTLARLADFVTRARSAVLRHGRGRELEYAPAPEMPARFVQQVFALLRGVSLVRQHAVVTEDDVRIAVRIGLDCIPPIRRMALEALSRGAETLTTSSLAQNARVPTTTIRRAMEDLQAQELVHCEKGGQGHADRWSLAPWCREMAAEFLTTVPEMSGEGVYGEQLRKVVI